MANPLKNTVTTLVTTTDNKALPDSADFWAEETYMGLPNGEVVSASRSSLLEDYPCLADQISTDHINRYLSQIKIAPTSVTIESLCDYPAEIHCKRYDIQGDDWVHVMTGIEDIAKRIYAALLLPYDTPSGLSTAQLSKFTKGQTKALTLLNQQLGTSGGEASARLYCMKMARTIICVNRNGLSNEFTVVFDKKGNKAENREARYQQIKCSVRAEKVCDVVRANKLLALDVATGKILQKIARDPDYELRNKVGHVKSNCKRDEHLQAGQAAQAAASDSQDEDSGRGKKRSRHSKKQKAETYAPTDVIDAVDPKFGYSGGETQGYQLQSGNAEQGDNDGMSINNRFAESSLRKLATPRSRLSTSSGFDGPTSSFNTEVAQPARNNPAQTTSYHPFSQYPFGQYTTETTLQIYDNRFSRVNGQYNTNNVTATTYSTTQQQQLGQMAQMPTRQPQDSVRNPHSLAPFTSFGLPSTEINSNLMDATSFGYNMDMLPNSINLGLGTSFDFDPFALRFGKGNNAKDGNVDDA